MKAQGLRFSAGNSGLHRDVSVFLLCCCRETCVSMVSDF